MSGSQKTNFDSLPAEMKASHGWILWRLEEDGERKRQKIPYQAKSPSRRASHSDDATWASFEEAVRALPRLRPAPEYEKESHCKGIGLVIRPPFVPVDFDKCRNPETGSVEPWAQEFINELKSYTEFSPSGKGYHV